MSRKSRKRERQAERVSHLSIASPRLSRPAYVNPYDRLYVAPLIEVEDRRSYHPLDFFRPAKMLSGHPVQPVNVNKTKTRGRPYFKMAVPSGLRFAQPAKTVMCVRRKTRREVIIAKSFTKRGRGSPKRKNWYSKIGC